MKTVYLVWEVFEFLGEYDFETDENLDKIFDSEEKAKEYIEGFYPEANYNETIWTYYLPERCAISGLIGLSIEEREVL